MIDSGDQLVVRRTLSAWSTDDGRHHLPLLNEIVFVIVATVYVPPWSYAEKEIVSIVVLHREHGLMTIELGIDEFDLYVERVA